MLTIKWNLIIKFGAPKRIFMQQETIENYLKTIYHLSQDNTQIVTNKVLSQKMGINPATVTEAVKKLHDLKLVEYEKSYGARLTAHGAISALAIVRRHRIWETYLAKELGFGWDEVHEIAEELEHIRNDKLIKKLSEKLGNPSYDPHGDPIPNEKGQMQKSNFIKLSEGKVGKSYKIMGVSDHSTAFLKHLEKYQLVIGTEVHVKGMEEFDNSLKVICNKNETIITAKVAENIIVE